MSGQIITKSEILTFVLGAYGRTRNFNSSIMASVTVIVVAASTRLSMAYLSVNPQGFAIVNYL